jgi:hypothetical protein
MHLRILIEIIFRRNTLIKKSKPKKSRDGPIRGSVEPT